MIYYNMGILDCQAELEVLLGVRRGCYISIVIQLNITKVLTVKSVNIATTSQKTSPLLPKEVARPIVFIFS